MLISQPKLNQDYPSGVVYLGDIPPEVFGQMPKYEHFFGLQSVLRSDVKPAEEFANGPVWKGRGSA